MCICSMSFNNTIAFIWTACLRRKTGMFQEVHLVAWLWPKTPQEICFWEIPCILIHAELSWAWVNSWNENVEKLIFVHKHTKLYDNQGCHLDKIHLRPYIPFCFKNESIMLCETRQVTLAMHFFQHLWSYTLSVSSSCQEC